MVILGLEMIGEDDYAMSKSLLFNVGLRNWSQRSGVSLETKPLDLGPWTLDSGLGTWT